LKEAAAYFRVKGFERARMPNKSGTAEARLSSLGYETQAVFDSIIIFRRGN